VAFCANEETENKIIINMYVIVLIEDLFLEYLDIFTYFRSKKSALLQVAKPISQLYGLGNSGKYKVFIPV